MFFDAENIIILILRVASVFQMLLILPILCYVIRIQFFGTFYKNNYPSKLHVLIFSLIICFLAMLVLFFCVKYLGALMGYIGAGVGLILIYVIPLIVNMIYYRKKHPPITRQNVLMSDTDYESDTNTNVKGTNYTTNYTGSDINGIGVSLKPRSKLKDTFFYISQFLLMGFGAFTLVIQIHKINIFGIKIE
jgi:hypothetical protein